MKKIAVVLFNLGGPDKKAAVQPFLFNLFHDPAIIGLPQPLRYMLAQLLSIRRAPIAYEIYGRINGGSPILKNTENQAEALEAALNAHKKNENYKCFIAMRYWHPFSQATVRAVKNFAPDRIVLLPLYPQFSTTTTGSSIKDWHCAAKKIKLDVPTEIICCYPQEPGFIRASANSLRKIYEEATQHGCPRILFSAHGLPEKIIKSGDPYQSQCEMTVDALRRELKIENLDSVLCYQSRVGPLKWIGPATDEEIRRAGQTKTPIIVVPVAFVSDHSETLVEINIEYRHLAAGQGVPFYGFVPAVGTAPDFIAGLAHITQAALTREKSCVSSIGARVCPPEFTGCMCSKISASNLS